MLRQFSGKGTIALLTTLLLGGCAISPVTLEKIGVIEEADTQLLDLALNICFGYVAQAMPAIERAAVLDRAAGLMEQRLAFFMALCAREAGKS